MKRDTDIQRRPSDGPAKDEPPGAQWMLAGIALVVGLLAGVALGAVLARDGGPLADNDGDSAVPAACRSAIDAARAELDARQEAMSAPGELADVLDRAAGAITRIDTAELEQVLSDLESLANEARTAVDELRTNEFETHATACESTEPTGG